MRIFFDSEFIDDGKTIDLISIGVVREDNQEYYAISSEFDESKASQWVKDNVLAKLEPQIIRRSRKEIAVDILNFVGPHPEFWGFFADYDWVVLCQLYGTMMQLPRDWPMFCMDIKQVSVMMGDIRFPKLDDSVAHNALADARWTRDFFWHMWAALAKKQYD